MNKTFRLLPLLAASAVVVGCQDYDLDVNIDDVRYKENFVAAFGQIDPNQNWDLYGQLAAGQGGMTRAASDITVTDLDDESLYALITKAENEAYQKMLPESDAAIRPYSATNLGRVTQDFVTKAKTITLYPIHWATAGEDKIGVYYYTTSDDSEATPVTDVNGETKYIVTKQVYVNKTHVYGLNLIDAYCYTDNVKYFVGDWDRPITAFDLLREAYPGKYYLDGLDKKVKTNGGTIETAAAFYSNYADEWKQDLIDCGKGFTTDDPDKYKDAWNNKIADGHFVFSIGQVTTTPVAYNGNFLYQAFTGDNPFNRLQSCPIEISIPSDVDFVGFYIDNKGSVRYSESALNPKVEFSDKVGEQKACFVATYEDHNVQDEEGNNVRYLCFEDWMTDREHGVAATNFDLNDIVFRVYGMDERTIVDYETYKEEALLVCEDLGDFDFDFNDIVLKLTYVKGLKKVLHYTGDEVTSVTITNGEEIDVTAMAAGGANESIVTIHPANAGDDTTHDLLLGADDVDGEIHHLLSGTAPSIINAGPKFFGEGITIAYPSQQYGVSWEDRELYPTYLSALFAKGFIKIVSSGKNANAITSNGSYTTTGNAPQMMLLPMSFEWPQEGQRISEVYPEFSTWVSDVNATDWINNNNGKVTKR